MNICNQETRFFNEIRSDTDSRTIKGYALLFDHESKDLGGFTELIERDALEGVVDKSDVMALLNHNSSRGVLARSTNGSGSLKLSVDEKGLLYEFDAPKTALGDELLEGLRRGDIRESSFSFTVKEDRWEKLENGKYKRYITKIDQLYDVSPVYIPAYSDTHVQVAKRSIDEFEQQLQETMTNYYDELLSKI